MISIYFPFLDGDIPRAIANGVYISQLMRFARCLQARSNSNNPTLFVDDTYNVRLDLPSGHPYSVFLLEDSAFKYTPSYDEIKNKCTLTFQKP